MLVTRRDIRGAASFMLALIACNDASAPSPTGRVDGVFVRLASDSLFVGRSVRVVAAAEGDSIAVTSPAFTWYSSDTNVVVVDGLGNALAVGPGVSTITASLADKSDDIAIRAVFQRADGGVPIAALATGFGAHCAIDVGERPECRAPSAPDDTVPKYAILSWAVGSVLKFERFATSPTHMCGIVTTSPGSADRSSECWGRNDQAQLGTGSRAPASVINPTGFRNHTSQVAVGGFTTAGSSFGSFVGHTCIVDQADSTLLCVGSNNDGELGHGLPLGTFGIADSAFRLVGAGFRARKVATGPRHTCALDLTGLAYCWGQLYGTGSSTRTGNPVLISATQPFVDIVAGGDWLHSSFACGLTSGGDAYCWGENLSGALGTGTSDDVAHPTPVRVAIPDPVALLVAGDRFACAVTYAGALYCWGEFPPQSISSRLGARRFSPYQLAAGTVFRSVSVDATHVCGLLQTNAVVCF